MCSSPQEKCSKMPVYHCTQQTAAAHGNKNLWQKAALHKNCGLPNFILEMPHPRAEREFKCSKMFQKNLEHLWTSALSEGWGFYIRSPNQGPRRGFYLQGVPYFGIVHTKELRNFMQQHFCRFFIRFCVAFLEGPCVFERHFILEDFLTRTCFPSFTKRWGGKFPPVTKHGKKACLFSQLPADNCVIQTVHRTEILLSNVCNQCNDTTPLKVGQTSGAGMRCGPQPPRGTASRGGRRAGRSAARPAGGRGAGAHDSRTSARCGTG